MNGMSVDALERLRSRIGVVRRPNPNRWNRIATADAIRHWAWGIGDDNPLWLSPDYARSAGHADVLAPPTFLYSCSYGPLGPSTEPSKGTGMPGLHALHAGDAWEFFAPVAAGDCIDVEIVLEAVNERPSSYAGRTIEQVILNRFMRGGEVVAQYRLYRRSHERRTAEKKAKWSDIRPWRYSDAEREAIAAAYEAERPRGADLIDWHDIVVGTEIPTRQKGPLTSTSMVAYIMAYGAYFSMTDRIAHEYMRTHPGAIALDREHNVPDFPQRAHWDDVYVREIGFPMGYDIGTQRVSWFAHLLTDWIGDSGRVISLSVTLLEPNWMWDLTTLHGRVVDTRVEPEGPIVDLELWAQSQRGRTHARGKATVLLGGVVNAGVVDAGATSRDEMEGVESA